MSEDTHNDIRKLLKTFGIEADEQTMAYVAHNPGSTPLTVRLLLEDITNYGDAAPVKPLRVEIEGEVRR